MIPVVRAVGIWQFGGPEVLQIVELPEPTPRACEICVRVIASTVNPADTGLRCGQFAGLLGDTQPPYVGGLEFAGVIEAVGPGSDWSVGDVVAALTSPFPGGRGSHAERVVVHARAATAVPDGIGLEAAATVPMNGMTARISLDTLGLAAGATVAITGAAGAVGAYATELAHAEGLRVIAVASREDASWLEELGADAVVERGPEAAEDIRRVAPSGVDGLIDAALAIMDESHAAGEIVFWQHGGAISRVKPDATAVWHRDAARSLLVPVDFLSSPNLERLASEQALIRNSP